MKKHLKQYIIYCKFQRRLNHKTIKAYRTDLIQFSYFVNLNFKCQNVEFVSKEIINSYIKYLGKFSIRTIRRKLASIKAFFRYLEYEEIIDENPFRRIILRIPVPKDLPKTLNLMEIKSILINVYSQNTRHENTYQKFVSLRDILIIELLLNTGIRVSELCNIQFENFQNNFQSLLISGKGNKERIIPLTNVHLLKALRNYIRYIQKKKGIYF